MSPRPRSKQNQGHPLRWRWKHGAWRYQVPRGMEAQWDGKREFTLGRTEMEAYRVWSERLQMQRHARTIADLLDRYAAQVVPGKAHKTRESNLSGIARLRAVFGHMAIGDLRAPHIYQYVDQRSDYPTSARHDVQVFSHAYTKAIEWGLVEEHPIKGKVRIAGRPPRDRYVTDEELTQALTQASPVVRAYVAMKVMTGLRRGDLLRLTMSDLKDDGVHVKPHKTAGTTGKRLIIEWTEDLRAAVETAKAVRPKISPYLFCTRLGEPYIGEDGTANGFDSLWARFMAKAVDLGVERFQERDLRAKTASDMPAGLATALLGHADPRITQRVYRRRAERVKPGKGL